MKQGTDKRGYTLVEMLVVVGILVVLFGLGVPAARRLVRSFDSGMNVKSVISTALGTAQAIAASEDTYAGVRFQRDRLGRQYMVLIKYDYDATGLANGFVAVANRKPTKLPDTLGVVDAARLDLTLPYTAQKDTTNDALLDTPEDMADATTFSIVFSKEGRLVTHDVQVMVRDVRYVPPPATVNYEASADDVFNTVNNVTVRGVGQFVQDGYPTMGWGREESRNTFILFDRKGLEAVGAARRWSGFLKGQEVVYVSPYSGEIVNRQPG